LIQTPWGEGKEIGVSAQYVIIKLKNGDIKFIEERKIIKTGEIFEYSENLIKEEND